MLTPFIILSVTIVILMTYLIIKYKEILWAYLILVIALTSVFQSIHCDRYKYYKKLLVENNIAEYTSEGDFKIVKEELWNYPTPKLN